MAEKAKPKKRSGGAKQALIMKKLEWMPVSNPKNSMYTDRLLWVLDKRIKKDPTLFVFYGANGKITWVMPSEQGTTRLRGMVAQNKKKHWFEKFGAYTVAKRGYLNDVEALASRIIMNEQMGTKNFARARNTTDEVRRDMNGWANAEMRKVNRTLRPLEKKYKRAMWRLDMKEKKTRKAYMKRIDKAKDSKRQKMLRMERDKKVMKLRMERKKLQPWRNSIAQWQAKARSFEAVKM